MQKCLEITVIVPTRVRSGIWTCLHVYFGRVEYSLAFNRNFVALQYNNYMKLEGIFVSLRIKTEYNRSTKLLFLPMLQLYSLDENISHSKYIVLLVYEVVRTRKQIILLQLWRWRQHVSPKHLCLPVIHNPDDLNLTLVTVFQ